MQFFLFSLRIISYLFFSSELRTALPQQALLQQASSSGTRKRCIPIRAMPQTLQGLPAVHLVRSFMGDKGLGKDCSCPYRMLYAHRARSRCHTSTASVWSELWTEANGGARLLAAIPSGKKYPLFFLWQQRLTSPWPQNEKQKEK